jgi:hypothetical protein
VRGEKNEGNLISQGQYSLKLSLIMSNYSFFHNLIRLPLVILILGALSLKSSYLIYNINTPHNVPSEERHRYVLEPNYRRLTVGNAAQTFPAMAELNEMGQMTLAVKHAHEERMENYKIFQMRLYIEAA